MQDLPELQRDDPQPTLLDLARWGAGLGEDLAWLEPPPQALFLEGRQQLQQLGLIDLAGQITKEGRHVATFGVVANDGATLCQNENTMSCVKAQLLLIVANRIKIKSLLSIRPSVHFANHGAPTMRQGTATVDSR